MGSIIFGWLFWHRSLEAAMVARAAGHVVFTLIAWIGALVANA